MIRSRDPGEIKNHQVEIEGDLWRLCRWEALGVPLKTMKVACLHDCSSLRRQ